MLKWYKTERCFSKIVTRSHDLVKEPQTKACGYSISCFLVQNLAKAMGIKFCEEMELNDLYNN